MKQFFKFVFASFFGMMLFSIVTGFFALCGIVGMITSQDATKEPEENSVLVLNLSGQLSERSDNNFLSQLQGTQVNSLGLDNMIEGIKKQKTMIISKEYTSRLVPLLLIHTHQCKLFAMHC